MATRKPLVVMTPKSLLRHKLAVSTLDELANGGFQTLIPDTHRRPRRRCSASSSAPARSITTCSRKRRSASITDVALVRVEQLYPFPRAELAAELKRLSPATEVVWCQEEPQNQGAWYQIQHHLRACLQPKQTLHYAGRARSPSPAAGHLAEHVAEQAQLVADALVNPLNGDHAVE